jgi:hypothetical protein
MHERLVMAYCASGPYKHASGLLANQPDAWLPWGYDRRRITTDAAPHSGLGFELWEIDDIRKPHSARCVAAGTIDFVQERIGYVAMTLQCSPGRASCTEDAVLAQAARGLLAFRLSLATKVTPQGGAVHAMSA